MRKFLVLLSALSLGALAAPTWVPIAKSDNGEYSFYIDAESTYIVDGLLEFSIKADSISKHNITSWRANCETRSAEILEVTYLDASGNVTGVDKGPMQVPSMPTNSIYDNIMRRVCSSLTKI